MKYFYLDPEAVSSSTGKNTIMDVRFHPPIVSRVHAMFDTWLGDVLVEDHPSYLVTIPAAKKISASGLTGVTIDTAEVSPTDMFRGFHPAQELPEFAWLRINGTPGVDDFGKNKSTWITGTEKPNDPRIHTLVVSERALKLLLGLGIKHADCSKFPG